MTTDNLRWPFVALMIAAAAVSNANVATPPAESAWALPATPDIAILSTSFPNCVLDTIDSSNKCLTDLEFYRAQILEATYHLGSMRSYSRALARMSSRLESARAAGQLVSAEYGRLHDALSDALDEANSPQGLYQQTYKNYIERYKNSVANAKRKIFQLTHQI